MADWGVTKHGFAPKTFEQVRSELQAELKEKISRHLQFEGPSIIGQITDIFAAKLTELWEVTSGVFHSLDPDVAQGVALDALSSLSGTLRKDGESDEVLRRRRILELRASGKATKEALLSQLRALSGLRSVLIIEDKTDHVFECVVLGGQDIDIAQTIWQNKPLGISTKGKNQTTIETEFGQTSISYTKAEAVALHLKAALRVQEPLSNAELVAIKTAILQEANAHFLLGVPVYPSRFYGPILKHQKIADIKELVVYRDRFEQPFQEPIEPNQYVSLAAERLYLEMSNG